MLTVLASMAYMNPESDPAYATPLATLMAPGFLSVRQLNIELDPDFVLHPYCASSNFDRRHAVLCLLKPGSPDIMPARFLHIHCHGAGLSVQSQVTVYRPRTGATRRYGGRSKYNFGMTRGIENFSAQHGALDLRAVLLGDVWIAHFQCARLYVYL